MSLQINPDLGDSVVFERLPGNKYQVSYWYVQDGGDKTLFAFVFPDDFAALTAGQQDELLFDWAQSAARITGVHE